MSSNQSLNSGRSLEQQQQQQQDHPGLAPRLEHVSQSTNGLNVNNNIARQQQQQQQQSSASIPGSITTTSTQHPLQTLSKSMGVQPIAPAGTALSSATKTVSPLPLPPPAPPMVGPPLILSSLAHSTAGMQHRQQQQQFRNSLHTPTIFQNTKFRAGKWIPEEEMYAELLIALFEKGRIVGCEKGTTLRSYLSQKLHCAPMRISKKYAGKGIGKMVYLSKLKPSGPQGEDDDDEDEKEHKAFLKRLKAAEEKFYRAVFPLSDPLLGGGGASFLPNNNKSFPLFNGMLPMFPPITQSLPFAMPPNNLMNNTFPPAGVGYDNTLLPTTTLLQLKAQVKQQQQQQQPPPPQQQQQQSQQQQQQQKPPLPPLAAKPEQPNLTMPMFPAQGIQVTDDASDLRQSFLRALHESDKKEKNPQDSKEQQQQPAHIIENKKGRIASKGGITLQKRHHHHSHHHHHQSTLNHTSVETSTKELPDFLSGFDRAAKSAGGSAHIKHQVAPNTNNEEVYSPTYTTRSFDDLHCLLGNGLPLPLEQNLAAKSVDFGPKLHPRAQPPRASPPEPVIATADSGTSSSNTLFTAESYAMFAQESARAASEHDAYLTGMGINVQQPKGESLDIEGTVNLVSEHVSNNQKPPQRQGDNVPTVVPLSTTTTTITTEGNGTSITWTKRAKDESPPPPITTGMSFRPGSTYYMSVVSASEPATETESNMSSFRESTSGSDNTDNNSTSEGNTDNNSSEGSDSEDSRKRKHAPGIMRGSEQHCNKKTRQTQQGRHLSSAGAMETFLSRHASS